jgi:hypothetical protein
LSKFIGTVIIAVHSIMNYCTIGSKYLYTNVVEELLTPRD